MILRYRRNASVPPMRVEYSIRSLEFSAKEMGIISAHISTREEVEKEKTKRTGGVSALTSEKIPTPHASPLKSLIESATREKEDIVCSTPPEPR